MNPNLFDPSGNYNTATTATTEELSITPEVTRAPLTPDVLELLNAIPIVCLDSTYSSGLRGLVGVKDEEQPYLLNTTMLNQKLIDMDYPAQHTMRALEKSQYVLENAQKWLEENASWLKEQQEIMDALRLDDSKKPLDHSDFDIPEVNF